MCYTFGKATYGEF